MINLFFKSDGIAVRGGGLPRARAQAMATGPGRDGSVMVAALAESCAGEEVLVMLGGDGVAQGFLPLAHGLEVPPGPARAGAGRLRLRPGRG